MKSSCHLLLLLFTVTALFSSAFASDTLHVISHKAQTVVTDPSKGTNSYKRWAVFPSTSQPIRKIVLHINFGCPDSMRCADWDYVDNVIIKRVGGVNASSKDCEIARLLTPYGGAFAKDWKFDWEVDVTDFSLLLRDSVEIDYVHSGYESNKDRGWKVTVDFELIKGKPAAEPTSIQKVYAGNFLYGDSTRSIEQDLKPYSFKKDAKADYAVFKIYQTGHGANEGDECGEFCSKYREVYFNDQLVDKRSLWKECSDNALYPQAGTWIFDRANWCPGYLLIPDQYLLSLKESNVLDVNMEPYLAKGKTQAVENITAYIIQYKKPAVANDVAIVQLINPATQMVNQRFSSVAVKPSVVIQNNGSKTLHSVMISYGTAGKTVYTYKWKGSLLAGKQQTIELPQAIDLSNAVNRFEVSLSKPNNTADAFEWDNKMAATFTAPPVHAQKIVVAFKTNKQPQHNSYSIINTNGEVVASRSFDSLQKEKIFTDTVILKEGVYQLNVKDTANDGLEFWFNTQGGSGYIRLLDEKGNLLKQFDPDFGCCINYSFEVSADAKRFSPVNTKPAVSLFPTRTTGVTTLDYYNGKEEDVLVQIITDEGATLVEEHQYKNLKAGTFTYNLSYRPAQRYYLRVYKSGELIYNKRIRVVEKVD